MNGRRGVLFLGLAVVMLAAATSWAGKDSPVFLAWLQPDDPGDQVIRVYWEKVDGGTATAREMVDLGTMLFFRGYPKDAVRLFRRALKMDESLAEAWFRMGAVYHSQGELKKARRAYRKCLKRFPGHGWCNFYLGLCDEQLGKGAEAVRYYRRAYRFAPELMEPRVNPAVLYSKLQAGARVPTLRGRDFARQLPMAYLEADKVAEIRKRFEPEPTPAPEPAPVAPAKPAAETELRAPRPAGPAPVVRPAPSRAPAAAPAPRPAPVPPKAKPAPKRQGTLPRPKLRPLPSGKLRPMPAGPAAAPTPTPTPRPE